MSLPGDETAREMLLPLRDALSRRHQPHQMLTVPPDLVDGQRLGFRALALLLQTNRPMGSASTEEKWCGTEECDLPPRRSAGRGATRVRQQAVGIGKRCRGCPVRSGASARAPSKAEKGPARRVPGQAESFNRGSNRLPHPPHGSSPATCSLCFLHPVSTRHYASCSVDSVGATAAVHEMAPFKYLARDQAPSAPAISSTLQRWGIHLQVGSSHWRCLRRRPLPFCAQNEST